MKIRKFNAAALLLSCSLLLGLGACASSPQAADTKAPVTVAVAVVPDFSPSFQYVAQTKQRTLQIAEQLQPRETFWLGAITENSYKKLAPLSFPIQQARTPAELKAFLAARQKLTQDISAWFDNAKSVKHPGSDVCHALRVAASELQNAPTARKALFVFSDMNDSVTDRCALKLDGIDVRLLFVYPAGKGVTSYDRFLEKLKQQFAAAHPQSFDALFPVQAQSFEAARFINTLRRSQ